MTFIERWAAKLGLAGILLVLLAASTVANVWLISRNAKAKADCEARIAALGQTVLEDAAARDTGSVEIASDAAADAEATVTDTQKDTQERQERVRIIFRDRPIPADCPRTLPDGVRDELASATSAANRSMRAR